MVLSDTSSWPVRLTDLLDSNSDMLLEYAEHEQSRYQRHLDQTKPYVSLSRIPISPHFDARDRLKCQIAEILSTEDLRGWHCTRLTDREISAIKSHGLQPQNAQLLAERIAILVSDGVLSETISERLIRENDASAESRAGITWFCFFEPWEDHEEGVGDFFRYWGGEALYSEHCLDEITGAALMKIGTPCIVEADIPVRFFGLGHSLSEKIICRYVRTCGVDVCFENHEDFVAHPIPAEKVRRIVCYGDPEFVRLSGCDKWDSILKI